MKEPVLRRAIEATRSTENATLETPLGIGPSQDLISMLTVKPHYWIKSLRDADKIARINVFQ